MDLKSGCAFEAGLEKHAQERRVLWDQVLLDNWEIKSFFDKNQKPNKFSKEVQEEKIRPPPQK